MSLVNVNNPAPDPYITLQGFGSEIESRQTLDDLLSATCFAWHRIDREVTGRLLFPNPHSTKSSTSVRIDYVLHPSSWLVQSGWKWGPIGIEAKASGEKIGPVIAQCQDYTRSLFTFGNGYQILLPQVFIWPAGTFGGTPQSIMAQYRIGTLFPEWKGSKGLVFSFAQQCGLRINEQQEIRILASAWECGRKQGSR